MFGIMLVQYLEVIFYFVWLKITYEALVSERAYGQYS